MTHTLIIKSLRDVIAECSCGHWHYTRPAFDSDSDTALRERVQSEHGLHVYLSVKS